MLYICLLAKSWEETKGTLGWGFKANVRGDYLEWWYGQGLEMGRPPPKDWQQQGAVSMPSLNGAGRGVVVLRAAGFVGENFLEGAKTIVPKQRGSGGEIPRPLPPRPALRSPARASNGPEHEKSKHR